LKEFAHHFAHFGLTPDGAAFDAPSSWLMPVRHDGSPAMLKIYKPRSDEQQGTDYLTYLMARAGHFTLVRPKVSSTTLGKFSVESAQSVAVNSLIQREHQAAHALLEAVA